MKQIFVIIIAILTLSCKKVDKTPELEVKIENIVNTTYNLRISYIVKNVDLANIVNRTDNASYKFRVNSGDRFDVHYLFSTKNQRIGTGTIRFFVNGKENGAIANGSGTITLVIP